MPAIEHIDSLPQLNKVLTANKDRLVVIDFHATWCGPCHAIAPVFEKLAGQYPAATFLKVDVDKAQDVARAYRVSAMPTFAYVKNERKVHEVKGANASAIEAGVKQFIGSASGDAGSGGKPFPGQGHSLSGTPIPTEVPPAEINYLKWLLLAAAAGYWFYSARSKAQEA
ncbi:hypothetical protein JCM10908_001214 [Rhodotorula pacifica]|uniref:thioredoxin family protein n=1 Tax=Rhodotorula pacifica TaxID=1495444 RepID=UPI00317AAD51